MKTTTEHDRRMAEMTFASVYPHYINKVPAHSIRRMDCHAAIITSFIFNDKAILEQL